MLYTTSILLFSIGLPILILGFFIIGIRRIFETEIIKNFISILGSKINKIDKKINSLIIGFIFFLIMYILVYPIVFILIIRHVIINKTNSKEYANFILIFIPLLLIWFGGLFFLIDNF